MNTDLQDIKNRLNIVDVLGEYLRLEKAGTNWRANCPFHNEKTPSFMVSEEKQIWHCFGCQKGGDIFSFVMEMEGVEFREALKMLAEKAGVKLQNFNPEKQQKQNKDLEILELATKFYEIQLWKGEGKIKIINYLKERGFSEEAIKEFRLGYAPRGWRNILSFLTGRGYQTEEIARTGLLVENTKSQISNYKQIPNDNNQNSKRNPSAISYQIQDTRYYDRFRDRIMFPVMDYSGRVVGFSARVAPGQDESQAKYVNTPESEVYHKSQVLYGLDKAKAEIKRKDFVLLVEGNADVIAASQAGIRNVVAVSGTALTENQINILKRYTKNIRMFFDMDSAGENATKKSLKACTEMGLNVRIISIPSGKDAADIAKENKNLFMESVEKAMPAAEYFFEKIFSRHSKDDADGKKKIADEFLDILKEIPDEIEKSHWLKKLAEGLDVAENILTDRLRKVILESRINREKSTDGEKNKDSERELPEKKELILGSIIGLGLIFPEVWKEIAKNEFLAIFSSQDGLLEKMIQDGEKNNYDFAKFISGVQEDIKKRAEKIFFENKFCLGLNNQIEEVVFENPFLELKKLERDLKIENKKDELAKIIQDLKVVQKKGDREAEKFLLKESAWISRELNDLDQNHPSK